MPTKVQKGASAVRDTHVYFYTLFLDMKYSDARTLTAEIVSIYIFLGRGWLVTIHSAKVDLMSTTVYRFLEEKNRPILELSIDALYYTTFFQAS
jgi:orotidine-5'-phosphate decarboxylase